MKPGFKNQNCFFVSDIHGNQKQYEKLFSCIKEEKPSLVLMGGDLFPSSLNAINSLSDETFISQYFLPEIKKLKGALQDEFPVIMLISGNDDPILFEDELRSGETEEDWLYLNNRIVHYQEYSIFGYPYVPPTPFLIKDWEKYDVSRYVDPGCVSPEEGYRNFKVAQNEIKYGTIKKDIAEKSRGINVEKLICLFHSPPYKCHLDRAALDGKMIDHVPLDVHVGSIAIREFFEEKKPYLGLHGHIHESARLTGEWKDIIGDTPVFTAAHDGNELSLLRFALDDLSTVSRELL